MISACVASCLVTTCHQARIFVVEEFAFAVRKFLKKVFATTGMYILPCQFVDISHKLMQRSSET